MEDASQLASGIFEVRTDAQFIELSFEIFRYQYKNNTIYRKFADLIGRTPGTVKEIEQIPFLPIELFKDHMVFTSGELKAETVFESSGTSGMQVSRHYVRDLAIYRESFTRGFELFFGPVSSYVFLALLPSYLERENSSLVFMVNQFVQRTAEQGSGFYLYEYEKLFRQIERLNLSGKRTILWGVSFALLDFIDQFPLDDPGLIVMETGGMKGRKKEIVREDLHARLAAGLGTGNIFSEYGMTEMLSQAYSREDGRFKPVPWLKILTREMNDPFRMEKPGKTGGINVIDLANIHSCSFIATQDLGRVYPDGTFEVLGRFDNSDVRGCSLLV